MAYAKKATKTEATAAKPLPQKDEVFRYVEEKYEDAEGARTTWINNQVKYNKLRMRTKKAKTFPFVGCSNIKMPTGDTKIRKMKAFLYNTVFGIRPVVSVVPPPSGNYGTALKIEKFLDHLIVDVMGLPNKAVITIDQELEQGFYLNMPYWKLEITKREETLDLKDLTIGEVMFLFDGKTTPEMLREYLTSTFDIDLDARIADENNAALETLIEKLHTVTLTKPLSFTVKDIVCDQPDIDLIDPERCFVPSDSGYNPQDCECIIVESYLPYHTLMTNSDQFGWDAAGIDEIGSWKGTDTTKNRLKDINKDLQEGIERLNSPSSKVRIWYYFGWYDIFGNGQKEKCVIICAPDFNKTIYKSTLPYFNGKFPLVKFFFELRNDRWYAHRGIIEMAEDIIKEIDIQHNMKIDQQTIRNAPMFLYRAGQVNPNLIQLIPNQAIPVRGLQPLNDTVAVVNNTNPNAEFSYEREQQILESKLEELLGQVDYTLQSQINKRQPRTLGEVQMQAQNAQLTASLDASIHTTQFTELFNFIWDLWCQYGKDEYEFNYFGKDGWEQIKLSKEEIQGRYKVTVRGNDRNTNPDVRLQKANQILLAATNPVLLQSGVVTPVQQVNALKRFYQYLEVDNWEELLNQQIQPPPPPPPASLIKPDFNALTDGEQAQVIASAGVQPDIPGRALRRRQELLEVHPQERETNGER